MTFGLWQAAGLAGLGQFRQAGPTLLRESTGNPVDIILHLKPKNDIGTPTRDRSPGKKVVKLWKASSNLVSHCQVGDPDQKDPSLISFLW